MKLIRGLIIVLLCLCSSARAADTWTISVTGVIFEGTDYGGIFGSAGRDLAGLNFTQKITSNVDITKWSMPSVSGTSTSMGGTGPGFSVVVTIDGVTHTYASAQSENGWQTLANALTEGYPPGSDRDQISSYNRGITATGERLSTNLGIFNTENPFVPTRLFDQSLSVTNFTNMNSKVDPSVKTLSRLI